LARRVASEPSQKKRRYVIEGVRSGGGVSERNSGERRSLFGLFCVDTLAGVRKDQINNKPRCVGCVALWVGRWGFSTECSMTVLRRQRSLGIDLIIIGLASAVALALRENFEIAEARWWAFIPYLISTLAVGGPVLVVLELDRSVWRFSGLAEYVRAVCAAILMVLGAVIVGFLVNRLEGIARSLPVLQAGVIAAGLIGVRVLIRLIHQRGKLDRGRDEPVALPLAKDTVLLIGWGSLVDLYVRSAAEFGNGSTHIAGILSPDPRHQGLLVQSTVVLGVPEDIKEVLADLEIHGVQVGRVVVATGFNHLSDNARQVLREIETTTDVRVDFLAERLGLATSVSKEAVPARPQRVVPSPLFDVNGTALSAALCKPYWRIKRLIDAVVAAMLLVVLLPLILVVALVVALDVGLPTLFVQQRPGLRGHRFNLYKFRTMAAAHDRAGHRIADEERVSPVGRFLRATRLDELPQLYNILVGDMSFVGPRPLVTKEQSSDTAARLLVRPGLTGWAQVSGGRVIAVEDKTALDVWYVHNASFRLDLKIVVGTASMLLFGERVDRAAVSRAWHDLDELGICAPSRREQFEAQQGLRLLQQRPAA
jgi:lipopolysaccharide/colanic/teichoic acid biosynthesis glycosyltransferase